MLQDNNYSRDLFILSRDAQCRIPGCRHLSEIKFAVLRHNLQESDQRLVRSFAGPPGLEDASRTEATRDRAVDSAYPTHGALKLTMSNAFQCAGLNSMWDDFFRNIREHKDIRVEQLAGIYNDYTLAIAEAPARSRLEAAKADNEIPFPHVSFIHESAERWTRVIATLGNSRIPGPRETVNPPTVLSPNAIHPAPDLQARAADAMDVEVPVHPPPPTRSEPEQAHEPPPGPPAGEPAAARDEETPDFFETNKRLYAELRVGKPQLMDKARERLSYKETNGFIRSTSSRDCLSFSSQ